MCYVVKFHLLVAFATWFSCLIWPVRLQEKSDSFGVTITKLSYKYGLLRTTQIQAFFIDTIIKD